MKNAKTSAKLLDSKDEFLYKNIFIYNNINKRKKTVNVIDNKLNIFYSENLLQYNQKMNRINDYLVKKGKPMIHQGVEKNSKGNMENMIKKIQFIKKIVEKVIEDFKNENNSIIPPKFNIDWKCNNNRLKFKDKIKDILPKQIPSVILDFSLETKGLNLSHKNNCPEMEKDI